MPEDNQAPRSAPITEPGDYVIDLTGPRSHTLVTRPGVGSLSIGPPGLGNKAELHVAPDAVINWPVFEAFATPAGSPWPRYLRYTGEDAGFLEWAQHRPLEEATWIPVLAADTVVDASLSIVHGLHIELGPQPGGFLSLTLPQRPCRLGLSGDLSRISVTGTLPSSLTLVPHTSRRKSDPPFSLPDLGKLHGATDLTLHSPPLGQPVSLGSLDRFPNLQSLSLWGSFCDLGSLARHTGLTNLELRFMPDLVELPGLDSWPLLDRFIAYNVEEAGGKRLRQQMKARAKARPWDDFASVSKLRKPEWWMNEYGRPFSAWPKRLAKLANEAYDEAQTAWAEVRSFTDAEEVITRFTMRFNSLKGIETTEREDLGEAVWQISQSAHGLSQPITEEMAQRWFDAARHY
ncbi:hypothetical protein HQN87_14430 [Paenibacillus tritici]|uniref:Transcriptional regulator n=1 Tax=Paenibacillus tritici TaxID=1873425 RepID=A0ABX2DQ43_9BACL|nr:hypothetical protein [Paenibacillus tritici]NQX46535.1 hypothetical protein [Paenibacillus tritici]